MTKLEAIAKSKTFRKKADELLQEMKEHRRAFMAADTKMLTECSDCIEAASHMQISINHIEDAIMRQGMALKYIGNPDPYPQSKDPSSSVVEPTADGLKM